MLRIVQTENQVARSFRLTVGLREGYVDGKEHTLTEVGQLIAQWLLEQRVKKKPHLPGSITQATMHYYGRESQRSIVEFVLHYDGEVSTEYNCSLSDDEVVTALIELADLLATKLKQERIYLRYRDRQFILENKPS